MEATKQEESTGSAKKSDGGAYVIDKRVVEEHSPVLFNIIYSIFTPNAPKATLKIGLIYLARIMDFYP